MASIKIFPQFARLNQAPLTLVLGGIPRSHRMQSQMLTPRRLLNTDTAPIIYSARANVIGARRGHVTGDNLNVDLTTAKALQGDGDAGKTNPEELFAAGYGACFQSAMTASAASLKMEMPEEAEHSVVETTVHLLGDMKQLDMGISVDMKVKVKGLEREDLEKIVAKAKEICPYSRAIAGNVTTNIEIVQMWVD